MLGEGTLKRDRMMKSGVGLVVGFRLAGFKWDFYENAKCGIKFNSFLCGCGSYTTVGFGFYLV